MEELKRGLRETKEGNSEAEIENMELRICQ